MVCISAGQSEMVSEDKGEHSKKMDNTIRKVPHEKCTGCGACANICPHNAILMEEGADGFYYPIITEGCVNCGLCEKSCPVLKPQYQNNEKPDCYAVWADDGTREKSSSGGVFSILAKSFLEDGGIVVGAAYTKDYYGVEHIIAEDESGLERLRGSKYAQSKTGTIYRNVKKELQTGKKVLFTGCPCQVAGLYAYLGKEWGNLYTLDLVCHGIPSQHLYQEFLREKEIEYGAKVKSVSFRDKKVAPWDGYKMQITFENGAVYSPDRRESAWMRGFLGRLFLRESCATCPFSRLPRQGDMTIADFWDIHLHDRSLDDRKGTSLVLNNNEKGGKLLEILHEKSKLCVSAPLEHGMKYNPHIGGASPLSPHRKRFFELINEYGYSVEKAVKYALEYKFDVGFVGWWYGRNYGSALTSFALNRYLKRQHKTVFMLEFPFMGETLPEKEYSSPTRDFANHFYDKSPMTKLQDFRGYNGTCDLFLTGSDQLWNWWSNRDVGTYYYFLDFADKWHKKIAYATSFGHEMVIYPEEMRLRLGYYLSRFQAISVREKSGVTVCKRDFDVDAVQTMDPVFLCDREDYEQAISLSNVEIKGNYLLAYILNPTKEKGEMVRRIASERKIDYYIILDGQGDSDQLRKEMDDDEHLLQNIRVEDWLKYFKNADAVFTDSYHGFCYTIIFEKPMIVFPNKLRGLARFTTLAELSGLENHFVYSLEELERKKLWDKDIDFSAVKASLKDPIEFSCNWLKNALEQDKLPPSVRELQLEKSLEHDAKLQEHEEKNVQLMLQIEQMQEQMGDMREYMCSMETQIEILSESRIHWLKRKVRGGIQCLKDNGLLYTIKRVGQKVKNKLH